MAVVARAEPTRRQPELVITQTHADVTRDVVATLEHAEPRATCLLLACAVAMFLGRPR